MKLILLLGVLVVVVIVFLDAFLAMVFIKASDRSFRTAHPYYHHGLAPNQKAIANWHGIRYPVYTNSLGFRDYAVRDIPLDTQKKRILFMGDSHTEGVGMYFEDTFTGQLLEKTDTSQTSILNAAAVSYSHRIYYLKSKYLLEHTGLSFDELFVFLDISDIQNELVYAGFEPGTARQASVYFSNIKHTLKNHSFIINTLSKVRKARQTNLFLKKTRLFDTYRSTNLHSDALDLYASFFRGFDDKTLLSNPMFHGVGEWIYDEEFKQLALHGMNLGKQNLMALHELCLQYDIKMTIVVHPWQEQIQVGLVEDMYVKFWKEFAHSNQIGFINLYPVFIDPPIAAVFGLDFFIPEDNHWNKNGHWLVANELLRYIQ